MHPLRPRELAGPLNGGRRDINAERTGPPRAMRAASQVVCPLPLDATCLAQYFVVQPQFGVAVSGIGPVHHGSHPPVRMLTGRRRSPTCRGPCRDARLRSARHRRSRPGPRLGRQPTTRHRAGLRTGRRESRAHVAAAVYEAGRQLRREPAPRAGQPQPRCQAQRRRTSATPQRQSRRVPQRRLLDDPARPAPSAGWETAGRIGRRQPDLRLGPGRHPLGHVARCRSGVAG